MAKKPNLPRGEDGKRRIFLVAKMAELAEGVTSGKLGVVVLQAEQKQGGGS